MFVSEEFKVLDKFLDLNLVCYAVRLGAPIPFQTKERYIYRREVDR